MRQPGSREVGVEDGEARQPAVSFRDKAHRATGRRIDQEGRPRNAGSLGDGIAEVGFVLLEQGREVRLITVSCVSGLHGGLSIIAGRRRERAPKS